MPPGWREARRQWKAQSRPEPDRRRDDPPAHHRPSVDARSAAQAHAASLDLRITAFRRRTAGTAVGIGTLAMINALTTPFVPWFLFPSAFMAIGWAHRAGKLWADGIGFGQMFGRRTQVEGARGRPVPPPPSIEALAESLAPRDVLDGPHGALVRQAAEDRAIARDVVSKLAPADRELIPDVLPTIDALAERVGSIAQALHRIDVDVRPESLVELEGRIAAVEREPASAPDRARKLELLQRQRATLTDLLGRRETLVGQLESASLMLQSMRLDLVALRSAGVQAALDDVSSATQEARALSREIEHVLDAAKQVRG
jgi:serine/threonine-protein kinase